MNILLINHYAGSPEMGMEFRPYYMSREWIKLGHNVTIIAGDYSHLRIKNPQIEQDFQVEIVDGIRYVWVQTGMYEGNGSARAFSMFRFVRKLRAHASSLARDYQPDVVIASSTYPFDTYAAQKIARIASAKLVHEVHDMWPVTLYEIGGMSRHHPFVALVQHAENSAYKNSDKVVSILCSAKDYMVEHGMAPEKFVPITNGIVPEEWESPLALPEEHKRLIKNLKAEHSFLVCFFGSHTKSYSLDYLIDAVQDYAVDDVAVVFVGDGNYKAELVQRAERKNADRFVFLPPIPKGAIPSLTAEADCLYVGAARNDMFRFGIGMNKLFDSMMAGKPLLYAVEAPNNYVRDYSCGVTVEPESVKALQLGIDELREMGELGRRKLGENGRKAVLENFTYQVLAERFLRAME